MESGYSNQTANPSDACLVWAIYNNNLELLVRNKKWRSTDLVLNTPLTKYSDINDNEDVYSIGNSSDSSYNYYSD